MNNFQAQGRMIFLSVFFFFLGGGVPKDISFFFVYGGDSILALLHPDPEPQNQLQ